MDEDWLAGRFEEQRPRLRAVAYRMLGTSAEADDAVQEAWLRLHRSDADLIDNLGGWLTTVVSRVCLDMLRSRTSRREDSLDESPYDALDEDAVEPEPEALQADSLGTALLVVLDTLGPAERLAFVLHDLFGMPFDEIAPIVDKSPAAARQLASRARRRVQGASAETDRARQREVVEAFLEASRNGEFERLLTLLDPDVVLRADRTAVESSRAALAAGHSGAPALASLVRGGRAVAEVFSGRAQAAQVALVDGAYGAAWAPGGRPLSVFVIRVRDGRVAGVEVVVDPEHLAAMDVQLAS
ncbi:sigma-70 family RNA polymerase sigma factor [Luteipulveratus flavus]|uniref:Sigma-70 family RNA polymerase sigma factor n=1 Tax=Luteipulveratus flavus TaxID=3031728 RepID=A0ABT6C9L9_9MICO|nr:sigma-70 family RNA polymerase sigma factor [Luteipulveratus sp. YIM 133296]MDF8265604.1 sigma-70 family RNA polymerase sigma factor [Luteipulveratus sp. YIM 133296]